MNRFTKTVAWILVASMVVVVGGCQTAREKPATTGTAVGAVGGAAAGAAIDKDNPYRGALIGMLAGAAIGGAVGNLIRKQQEAFDRIEGLETQQQTVVLQESPPPTAAGEPAPEPEKEEKAALRVRVPSEVLFPVGSSALSGHGKQKLTEVAAILKEYPGSDVIIQGYTSSEGDDQMNYDLSVRRAQVVKNQLVANGVAASRLYAQGMGESNPIASNETEAGRVQNRRVEIIIIPREQ